MAGFSPKDLGIYRPPGYEEIGFAFLIVFRSECWYQIQRAKWIEGRGNVLFRSLEVIEDNDCPLTQEEIEACFPVRERTWRLLRDWLADGTVRAVSVNDLGDVNSVPPGFWRTHQGLEALESGVAASSMHDVAGAVFVNEIDLYDAATDYSVSLAGITTPDDLFEARREPRQPLALVERSPVRLIEDALAEKGRGRPREVDEAEVIAAAVKILYVDGLTGTQTEFVRELQQAYRSPIGKPLTEGSARRYVAALWKRLEAEDMHEVTEAMRKTRLLRDGSG